MDAAVRARAGARDAVGDVTPDRLREVIFDVLDGGAMTPGALTILAARAVDATDDAGAEARAAGVQLIYEGLALTRDLARDEPWTSGDTLESDMAILAADVMVSRGFYLLAQTEAATQAVATVRAFGRDQTERRVAGVEGPSYALEADVFELAIVAGTTLGGVEPPTVLREYAIDLAHSFNGAPTPEVPASVPDPVGEAISKLSATPQPRLADDPPRSSWATDP